MPDLKNRWPPTTHAWMGIFLLCIAAYSATAQRPTERGNLRQTLRGLQQSDTNYINTLFKFGETYELDNNDSAFYYYRQCYALSKKINYITGQLRYRDYTAVLLVYLSRYDEAIHHLDSAMEISIKHNRRRFQATEYNHYGTIWQYKSEMNKAAEYYMRAYRMAESINDSVLMNAVAGNLSGVFLEIRRYDKAREFSQLNYDIAAAMNDTLSVGYGLVNLSSCELEDGNVALAKVQSRTAINIARQFADEALEMFALYNFGTALRLAEKPDSAIMILSRVRAMAQAQDIPYHAMYAAQGLGDSYSDLKNFPRAIDYYEQALDLARKTSNRVRQAQLNLALAANHEKHGSFVQAVKYWKQYNTLNDSINLVEQNRNISELEASYQSEKRQREILDKNLQIELEKNKAATRLIWIGGMSALLITAFIVILLRVKISRVREQNLKSEMKVKILKAGENERSRIAKDLHDDVGATLSSIHIYSKAAEMHMLTKPEEVPILVHRISENSERMMDKMSDIIWSMNSNEDAGEKLVLRIKTFASEILGSKEIETTFDLDALENIDVSIFARKNLLLIFKEAINNMAKYSQARHVSFRCFLEAGALCISIKDDGVGFDVSQAVNGNGMGNMKHRTGLLGGTIEINSSLGSGSSIIVRIPIAKISDGVTEIFLSYFTLSMATRITIFDDNTERRESLKYLMGMFPDFIFAGAFEDCSDVIQKIEASQPDVVLMDIQMPKVNGIEGVRMIRSVHPEIIVIMQTIFEDDDSVFESIKAGAAGYILKKASPDKIAEAIRDAVAGGSPMTPSIANKVLRFFQQNTIANDYDLTARERELLGHLVNGLSYKMIADKCGISFHTVNSHLRKIYEKLHVHSLGEAVSKALKEKLV